MNIKVIRATETWQRAGAYYVRIQGMSKQHGITLQREFDEHDTPDTKYILLTDDEFPVATCRLYRLDADSAMLGRVVVLPEYRGKGLGRQVILEAEEWLKKLGFAEETFQDNMESFLQATEEIRQKTAFFTMQREALTLFEERTKELRAATDE